MSDYINRLTALNHRHVWHPFTQMQDWVREQPLFITGGEGVYLIDAAGRRYYDGNSSMWVNLHGHRHPRLDAALREQIDRIAHSTLLGLATPSSTELAARLADIAPPGLTRVFYSDNGSTAVEVAVKMALQYWQHRGQPRRTVYVTLQNAYHGDTVGAVSVGAVDTFHAAFKPLLFRAEAAPSPYCYRCPLGKQVESCGLACAAELERIVAQHAERGELAAVVVEPLIQAAGGMITPPRGYLRRVRDICDRYGVLLIADEVATGFGRTGTMFACEQEGVVPDLMALSKGITGGYLPLAVTLATEEIYQAFLGEYRELKTFFHGHSYTGNALACAAALANLGIFAQERVLEQLPAKIEAVRRALEPVAELPHVGDIRQAGLMVGIELVRDRATREPYPWEERVGVRACLRARDYGMITRPLGNVVVFMPPLASTVQQLEEMVDILRRAIIDVTEAEKEGAA